MDTTEIDRLYASMAGCLRELLARPRHAVAARASWPNAAGVYAIFDGDRCLYVGRTGNVRMRLRSHCAPYSSHDSASFAFRLTRAALDHKTPSYRTQGGRRELANRPAFSAEFARQRARVGAMQAAFIELPNDESQALFEIFAAKSLSAEHSKFKTT
jgi:hypothetical protein